MNRTALRADALLLTAAAVWGGAFVVQRMATQNVGPLTFNGLRFGLGAVALLPVMYGRREATAQMGRLSFGWVHVAGAVLAGLVLTVAAGLQQMGLVYTTAGKAGFITGLYVVLVPAFGLLVGQRPAAPTWVGVGLAVAGLYLLCVTEHFEVNRGDWLVAACAVACAAHVLIIAWLAPQADPIRLAVAQYAVVAAASLLVATLTERMSVSGISAAGGEILYGGVLSVGVGFTLQLIGQRHAPAAHAGILMSFEAVFAALAGWAFLAESLSRRELAGAGLMLAGMLASQVGPRGVRAAEARRNLAAPGSARPSV
jgi:drug/metabolite transporter (DMT)-like permease